MNKKSLIGNFLLILAAFIWGCAFVAQSIGMDFVRPFTFNGIRSLLAGIVLLTVIFIFEQIQKKKVLSKILKLIQLRLLLQKQMMI